MIAKDRFDALMQLRIDPKLYQCHEASVVSAEMAAYPHKIFDGMRAQFGDVMEVKDNRVGDVLLPTMIPMHPDRPGILVTGYATVKEVLANPNDYFQNYVHSMDILMGEGQIAGLNAPEHGKLRPLLKQAFDKGSVDELQTSVILPLMEGLLDRIAEKKSSDLVEDFTCQLPLLLIGEIFQLPTERYDDFANFVSDLMNFNFDWEKAAAASQGFGDIFYELIEERKLKPGDDLISRMLDAEIDGRKLSDIEMMSFCRALVPAGVETTTRALSSLFTLLLTTPGCWETLGANPDLVRHAVEEAMRFSGPAMMVPKRTTRDVQLAGQPVAEDTNVWVCIGHANRDPSIWENPHEFHIQRARKPHLAFSQGAHGCIGNQLARREMQDAVRLMVEKFPNMRLDPDKPAPTVLGVQHRSADRIDVVTA